MVKVAVLSAETIRLTREEPETSMVTDRMIYFNQDYDLWQPISNLAPRFTGCTRDRRLFPLSSAENCSRYPPSARVAKWDYGVPELEVRSVSVS